MSDRFHNDTRWAAAAIVAPDAHGHPLVVVVLKGTFLHHPDGPLPAQPQRPIRLADEHHGGDPQRSVRLPGDVCPAKRGCDVVIVGDAMAPHAAESAIVSVQLATRRVALSVSRPPAALSSGNSDTESADLGWRFPLNYESAAAGPRVDGGPIRRNPVGIVARDHDNAGTTPTISWQSPPEGCEADDPAGFGAVAPGWHWRKRHFGLVSDEWRHLHMPLAPDGFDIRYHNVAHPALQLDAPPKPGACLSIVGMTTAGHWMTALPELSAIVRGHHSDGDRFERPIIVDTLVVEPEGGPDGQGVVELTGRAAFAMRGDGGALMRLEVFND